jgi:hypothetical protein
MERLLEALRRNPDAVAIAVLCLTLGIGRHIQCMRAAVSHRAAPTGIHWIWTPDAQDDRLDTTGPRWNPCLPDPPEPPALPAFSR